MRKVYLDHAATTPTDLRVKEAMQPYYTEIFGNPSSFHSFGQSARKAVEDSREKLAALLGARPEEIVFTSGGTESDNFALEGTAYARESKGNHIITTNFEHHAILETCDFLKPRGFEITLLPVSPEGLIDPEQVKKAITDKTILVSIMHANNEIGTIQPIAEVAKITKEKGIYFHTDAVQTIGHLNQKVDDLGVNLLSFSGHKFYGPKGIGALYIRKGTRITPFLHGGSQERGRRASTENVPGIVGLGKAAEIAMLEMGAEAKREENLREKLWQGLLKYIPEITLNGHPARRLPNNLNVTFTYVEGESILLNLDLQGVAVSTGSACTSGSLDPSHVLLAISRSPEAAHGSVRFSLGKATTEADIDYVIEVLPPIIKKLRAMSPLFNQ